MEPFIVLLVLFALAAVVTVPILTLVAFFRTQSLRQDIQRLRDDLDVLEARLAGAIKTGRVEAAAASSPAAEASVARPAPPTAVLPLLEATPPPSPPEQAAEVAPPPAVPSAAVPLPRVSPAPSPALAASASTEPRPTARAPRPAPDTAAARPPAGPPEPDFATNIGPKIMVGVAALFVVISLGLFVRYAWENDWVGPTGRVLFGAAVSIGLLAFGTRILGREYRPLGQALAATGIAGLYVCAFGAHGFYDLIPRGAAGFLMVVITACAVLLAVKLDARLLAGLAWVGGYLTPVLLSTGEDRAMALFLYLVLLDVGALVLDHLEPWPETIPLAMLGTLVLYGGWYARFISAENFLTAAFGMVLFTAVFALGMARKQRSQALGVVFGMAALGLTALASVAGGRSEVLLALSLGLAAVALRSARQAGPALSVVAGVALVLPCVAWLGTHHQDLTFGLGAGWIVAGTLLFVVSASRDRMAVPLPLEAVALVVSGFLTVFMAGVPKGPLPLLALLLAQGGIALLAQRRWAGAELTALVAAGLAVMRSCDRFLQSDGPGGVYLLALPVFGFYLLAQVVRGFRNDSSAPTDQTSAVAQLVNAIVLWSVLYRVLYANSPGTLGFASVGLAALYLGLGLTSLRAASTNLLQVRMYLGLAACFLTVAIPVQLGLHGITLAWAVEALVLLGLGVRFESMLTRLGAYGVLALSVLRLFARHLPLHPGPFAPVLNPSFAIWIAVILCLAVALLLTREPRREGESLDETAGPIVSVVALLLLFGLLTGETMEAFKQIQAAAVQAGNLEAERGARLMGGLSLSVLWSLFATGLLAGGLGLRSRALFYSAYGLFALTAAKIVLVDLATLQTLYRILSFLAMGVLLMAGAYLAIRFRERLIPAEEAQ